MYQKVFAVFSSLLIATFGLMPSAQAFDVHTPEGLIVKSSVEDPSELQLFRHQEVDTLARGTYLLSLPRTLSFERAKSAYLALDHVEYVEPNLPIEVHESDDTEYVAGNLWGMQSGFGTNAASAWSNGFTGSDQV